MSRALSLYRLQQLDLGEEQRRRRLVEIAAALGESPGLRSARDAVQKAEARVRRAGVCQRDLDLAVKGLKQEIAATEQRLYSGSIRNPKELEELQAKVASLKRLQDQRDEELLEAMIESEEADETQVQATQQLAATEAAWSADQSALRAEQAQLEAHLQEIAGQREALLPSIPPADLERYRVLRREKAGQAVAVLQGGACMTCGMEIPPAILARGQEAGLPFCGNCGRALVLKEELDRAA